MRSRRLASGSAWLHALPMARDLIVLVERIVRESGDGEPFDAVSWLAEWLQHPVPALGGRAPRAMMGSADGRAHVFRVVAQMQSGAYG